MGRRWFGPSFVLALTPLLAALPSAASAGWWSHTRPQTTMYAPQVAMYAPQTAYYAQPQTAYYAAQTAYSPAACGTCTRQVCSYVPQTTYQTMYRDVPVTAYHPVTTVDHCSGCPWTSYRPVTQCVRQAYYVPQTTYRQVCSQVTVAMQPVCAAPACATAAYVAQPAVAQAVVPAAATAPAAACCGNGTAAPAAAPVVVPATPGTTSPSGVPLPQPQIDPATTVPNASGQMLNNGASTGGFRTQETARPQVFPRPSQPQLQPAVTPPRGVETQDRVAGVPRIGAAVYTPVALRPTRPESSIRPASAAIAPAASGDGWVAD